MLPVKPTDVTEGAVRRLNPGCRRTTIGAKPCRHQHPEHRRAAGPCASRRWVALPRPGAHPQFRVHRRRIRVGDNQKRSARSRRRTSCSSRRRSGGEHRRDSGGAGIRSRVAVGLGPIVGYSPIIGGKPLRGMADECLTVIGWSPPRGRSVGITVRARATGCSTAG